MARRPPSGDRSSSASTSCDDRPHHAGVDGLPREVALELRPRHHKRRDELPLRCREVELESSLRNGRAAPLSPYHSWMLICAVLCWLSVTCPLCRCWSVQQQVAGMEERLAVGGLVWGLGCARRAQPITAPRAPAKRIQSRARG